MKRKVCGTCGYWDKYATYKVNTGLCWCALPTKELFTGKYLVGCASWKPRAKGVQGRKGK